MHPDGCTCSLHWLPSSNCCPSPREDRNPRLGLTSGALSGTPASALQVSSELARLHLVLASIFYGRCAAARNGQSAQEREKSKCRGLAGGRIRHETQEIAVGKRAKWAEMRDGELATGGSAKLGRAQMGRRWMKQGCEQKGAVWDLGTAL